MCLCASVCVYFTSSSPTATDSATPVERRGRLPWGTGQGSLWSSPSKSVRFISTLCTGWRNLDINTHAHIRVSSILQLGDMATVNWQKHTGCATASLYLQEAAASLGAGGRPCGPDAAGFVKPNISWNTEKQTHIEFKNLSCFDTVCIHHA